MSVMDEPCSKTIDLSKTQDKSTSYSVNYCTIPAAANCIIGKTNMKMASANGL